MAGPEDTIYDVENGWSEYGEPPPEYGSGGGLPPDEGDDRERQSEGEDFGNGPEWRIARLGHVLSGGGTIGSGSKNHTAGGSPIARAGDVGFCLKHRMVVYLEDSSCSEKTEVDKSKVGLCGYTYVTCGCLVSENNIGQEYSGR